MKADIHPAYHKAKITCACGAKFELGSTLESYSVDICAKCHPFYTGKQKLVDTAGRVDKFRSRMEAAEKMKSAEKVRLKSRKTKETVEERVTRKAEEKEAAKLAEKAEKEAEKKEAAKKKAEKIVVKPTEEKPAPKEKAEKKSTPKKPAKKK